MVKSWREGGRWSRRRWPWRGFEVSPETLIVLVCGWFVLVMNGPLWSAVRAGSDSLRVLLSLGAVVFALHALLLGLVCWGRLTRPLLAVLLVVTAVAHWYMTRYAVVFDVQMVRNVLHTDVAESRELLSGGLVLHVLLLGMLPAVPVLLARPLHRTWRRAVLVRGSFVLVMALLAGAALGMASQEGIALLRGPAGQRHRVLPGSYIAALVRVLKPTRQAGGPVVPVGRDAHRPPEALTRTPRLLVLVVGETVRGDHWGLNGYARQTTPELAARAVVNFPQVTACGTSTEVSLPCMFSAFGRKGFDPDTVRSHESLLDVVARAGVRVMWRDNQSGCKGTCVRVSSRTMGPADAPGLCKGRRCLDEILLVGLQQEFDAAHGDALVVLHMLGNHGPTYFERYPPRFERWRPVCRSAELNRCPIAQIVNAYDNAILYTDAVLGRLIDLLARQAGRDTAMLYLSDHGESLGEYGLFLHGAPYSIAPRAQLHVPMTLWMSPGWVASVGLDLACLHKTAAQPTSHDALFSTVLGAFDVRTSVYRRDHDLLAPCRIRG